MASVFISYSSRDAEFATKVAEALEENGIDVWIDRKVQVGDDWRLVIEEALQNADSVLILMSPSALNSPYIAREYQYALSQPDKPLYVASIEPVPADEIPYPLQNLHYVDLTQSLDAHIEKLAQMIKSRQAPHGLKRLYQSSGADGNFARFHYARSQSATRQH